MSGTEKLSHIIEHFGATLETVKQSDLTLDEMMAEFHQALESYKSLREILNDQSMEVLEIRIQEDGSCAEQSFSWQSM